MPIELIEPTEDDSIDCHLQQVGMGSLICRTAQQTGHKNTTNIYAVHRPCPFSCFVLK